MINKDLVRRLRERTERLRNSAVESMQFEELADMSPEQLLDYFIVHPNDDERVHRFLEHKGIDYMNRFQEIGEQRDSEERNARKLY